MSYKFDVFISYRHSVLDRAVAEKLHKKLERYHISRDIQKKVGKKKIARVFRDQDELSIGHDLSEEIEEQLRQSEFLAVICSPSAKESAWVSKEITTFLKYHSASHILPILIEGVPETAFPDELLSVGEPFAADIRGNTPKECFSKLNKEIDRIVAPILQCSYDELHQRQKRYRMQRLLAAMAASILLLSSFLGYAIYQNKKIVKAYNEQLETESELLVSQAEQSYENGDYFGAMRELLQALPSEKENRPLIPEAQNLLTDILGVYKKDDKTLVAGGRIEESHGFDRDIYLDKDGKYLVAHLENRLLVYDAGKMTLKHSYSTESSIMTKIPTECFIEDLVYFSDQYSIYCYNYKKNEMIWKKSNPNRICEMIVSKDGENIWVLTEQMIYLVNQKSGKFQKKQKLSLADGESIRNFEGQYAQTSDGKMFAFRSDNYNESVGFYYIYDSELNMVDSFSRKNTTGLDSICFHDTNTLLFDYYEADSTVLEYYDIGKKESLWKENFTGSQVSTILTKNKSSILTENAYWYSYGSKLVAIDVLDGKVKYNINLDGKPVAIGQIDDEIMVFSSTGYKIRCYLSSYNNAFCDQKDTFFPKSIKAMANRLDENGYFVMGTDGSILKYVKNQNKPIPLEMEEDIYDNSIKEYMDGLAGISSDSGLLFFCQDDEVVYVPQDELDLSPANKVIDASEEDLKVLTYDDSKNEVIFTTISSATHAVDKQKVLLKGEEDAYYSLAYGNHIFAALKNGENEEIIIIDTQNEEEVTIPVEIPNYDDFDFHLDDSIDLSSTASYISFLQYDQLYMYIFDRDSQKIITKIDLVNERTDILEGLQFKYLDGKSLIVWSQQDNYFAIPFADTIDVYGKDGKCMYSIPYNETREKQGVASCSFSPDETVLYYVWKGELYAYSLKDGKEVAKISLADEIGDNVSWQYNGEQLYFTDSVDSTSKDLYVVNTNPEHFGLVGKISDVIIYNTKSNRIYVSYVDDGSIKIGYYEELSLEDIIEIAEKEVEEDESE